MIRIAILTCIWKRHDIAQVFLEQINKLKEYDPVRFHVDVVCVGSEGDISKNLVLNHGAYYVEHANKPLGRKFNAGLKFCKQLDPDYLMVMGSDDIVNTRILEVYEPLMRKKVPFVGLKDLFFYDTRTKNFTYWPGYAGRRVGETIGAGRILSRELLKRCKWVLWTNRLHKGLDRSMTKKVRRLKVPSVVINGSREGIMIIDIKSALNMSKLVKFTYLKKKNKKGIARYFGSPVLKQLLKL